MKKVSYALVLAMVLISILVLTAVPISAQFRCGTRLIQVGETKSKILSSCGAPTLKDYGSRGGGEVWTYNLGPTRRMRILRFTGDKLTAVENGDYGFNTPPHQR
ncbi:MAG: DUF2845 domain-containing protein [Deltaproteobacteria bacterium]|nr:MAG: DUF2845 domain-containing protein [Deltaproteobacteria bacterium]